MQLKGIKMKKESSTTRKVVNLSEEKFSRMSEDQLLAHVIDTLVGQVSQLVLLTTEMSRRISKLEKANQPSSASNSSETPLLP